MLNHTWDYASGPKLLKTTSPLHSVFLFCFSHHLQSVPKIHQCRGYNRYRNMSKTLISNTQEMYSDFIAKAFNLICSL